MSTLKVNTLEPEAGDEITITSGKNLRMADVASKVLGADAQGDIVAGSSYTVGTGAENLVRLGSNSELPVVSGAQLTALNATQLTSGTVPDARFPATIPASSGVNLTALNATQLTSGQIPSSSRLPAGSIAQIKHASSDSFSTSSAQSFVDISGLTLDITPLYNDSKMLIHAHLFFSHNVLSGDYATFFRVKRLITGGTAAYPGSGDSSSLTATIDACSGEMSHDKRRFNPTSFLVQDNPQTSVETNYTIQWYCESGGSSILNRCGQDGDTT